MKKILSLACIVCFLGTHSAYAAIKAKCSNDAGKLVSCNVDTQDGNLVIKMNKETKSIAGKSITALTSGDYSKRHIGMSTALAVINPIFLVGLLRKKQSELFGVEFKDGRDPKAMLIQADKKTALGIKSILQSVSGRKVIYDSKDKTLLDKVGI